MAEPAASFSRRTALQAGLLALGTAVVAAYTSDPPTRLRPAAGEVGGFFREFAGLLSDAVAKTDVAETVPLTTAGSADNLEALGSRQAELAPTLINAAYSHPSRELTAVGCVYENYFHVAVRADSAIESTDDLRGRNVSIGAPWFWSDRGVD